MLTDARPSKNYPTIVLARRYGLTPSRLISWERAGWIAPASPRRGSGYPITFEPWAQRMIALLAAEQLANASGGEPVGRRRSQMLRELAAALRRAPHADWFADVGRRWEPCSSAAEAVALAAAAPGGAKRIASPPPAID